MKNVCVRMPTHVGRFVLEFLFQMRLISLQMVGGILFDCLFPCLFVSEWLIGVPFVNKWSDLDRSNFPKTILRVSKHYFYLVWNLYLSRGCSIIIYFRSLLNRLPIFCYLSPQKNKKLADIILMYGSLEEKK